MKFSALHIASLILIFSGLIYLLTRLFFLSKIKLKNLQIDHLSSSSSMLEKELEQEKKASGDLQKSVSFLQKEHLLLDADYRVLKSQYDLMKNDDEAQLKRFKVIANAVLDKQTEVLNKRQEVGIKNLLAPLGERIKYFDERLEKSTLENVKRGESLKEQIRFLSEKSDQVSKDANNLARALKGDFKSQGSWGEMILNSILEKSGLVKGREYTVQESGKKDGKTYRPDVVLHLPDNKKIIVDSKVSLNAYNLFVNAESEEGQISALNAHILALKNHIIGLSTKNYHELYHMESPNFVLMFVPIDTALSTGLKGQPDLYTFAFDKNIIIVTPSTLLATLKTIETLWRNENINKNAIAIAIDAGKMYDKFVAFIEDFKMVGSRVEMTKKAYDEAYKKLSEGTGNLITRAEKLKILGAKANKMIKK